MGWTSSFPETWRADVFEMACRMRYMRYNSHFNNWAPSSEFVSSSIPSWQVLTAHAQPFREARDLAFCLKVPLDSLLVWASSEGSGETARMRRLAWTFAACIGDKYEIRLTRSIWQYAFNDGIALVLTNWHFCDFDHEFAKWKKHRRTYTIVGNKSPGKLFFLWINKSS